MLGLEYFSFEALWSPVVMFIVLVIGILYFYAVGPWREKHFADEPPVAWGKKTSFLSGLILYYLVQGGPMELLGHMMFTFHMANMAISYLVVPPLVLLGVPSYIWKFLFDRAFWRPLKLFTSPILALLLFNVMFSVYHFPDVHDYVMTHMLIHRIYYFLLLVAAFLMWWQIVSPVPEWSKLSYVKKMGYIFANGLLLTPACALIIFNSSPMYAIYSDPEVWAVAMGYCVPGDPAALLARFEGPAFFSLFSPLEDQQLGGILMKLIQEVMYGAILGFVFINWFRKEHKENEADLPPGSAGAGSV